MNSWMPVRCCCRGVLLGGFWSDGRIAKCPAFCCNSRLRAVNDGALKSAAPTITARPTPQEKRTFAALAAQRQISESTLALIAIRAWLDLQSPDLLPHLS